MIKQIKRWFALEILLLETLACLAGTGVINGESSDVVENTSVIDEQVAFMPMAKAEELTVVPLVSIEEENKEPESKSELETETEAVTEVETETEVETKEIYYDGWTNTRVSVRLSPSVNTTVLTTYDFNTPIRYTIYDDEWVKIEYDSGIAYMAKKYISDTKCKYNEISVPNHEDFKSYMGYEAITSTSSMQYKIQSNYAYTGKYGIRQVDGRFCVALGSYFNVEIGQYFDLILKNGTIIPCIMGDAKADKDTDSSNIFTTNGCCSEFIVDSSALITSVKRSGTVSSACEEWNSQVTKVRIYEKNILD